MGVGVQYELCVNINVEDGMTNGSPCIVQFLDFSVENSSRCSIIWVMFEDKSTGKLWRENMLIYITRTFHLTGQLF